MKIVLFGNSAWCIYNFRSSLIKELVRQGHEVSVVAPIDPTFNDSAYVGMIEELSADVHRLPLKARRLNPFGELYSVIFLLGLLACIRPDVVLSYTVKCNLYAGLCRKLFRYVQIANVPGLGEVFEKQTWVQIVVRVLYKFAFRGVQTAFFQNKEDLAYCVENRLVSAQCCKLLPGSGVNLDRFCESLPPRSPAQRVFMMYGRLLPQKGYYIFMEAARILRSKLGDSAQCWILGIEDQNRAQSRELLVAIKEAARLGIVRHLPAVVDVRPVLAEVDVVVLPSYYNEGVPRSILEAMACGKPVIASDWKGCRETVRDSKNGFLVPVRDVHALVQAMLKMNSMSDEELRAMGRASRRIAEQYYDEREVLWLYLREILGEQADADDVLRRRFVLPGAALARDGSSERLVA